MAQIFLWGLAVNCLHGVTCLWGTHPTCYVRGPFPGPRADLTSALRPNGENLSLNLSIGRHSGCTTPLAVFLVLSGRACTQELSPCTGPDACAARTCPGQLPQAPSSLTWPPATGKLVCFETSALHSWNRSSQGPRPRDLQSAQGQYGLLGSPAETHLWHHGGQKWLSRFFTNKLHRTLHRTSELQLVGALHAAPPRCSDCTGLFTDAAENATVYDDAIGRAHGLPPLCGALEQPRLPVLVEEGTVEFTEFLPWKLVWRLIKAPLLSDFGGSLRSPLLLQQPAKIAVLINYT